MSIKFLLNGVEKNIDKSVTIAQLVEELGLDVKKIAVEKDLEIVAVDSFSKTFVEENCKIEIVHFIGGG